MCFFLKISYILKYDANDIWSNLGKVGYSFHTSTRFGFRIELEFSAVNVGIPLVIIPLPISTRPRFRGRQCLHSELPM